MLDTVFRPQKHYALCYIFLKTGYIYIKGLVFKGLARRGSNPTRDRPVFNQFGAKGVSYDNFWRLCPKSSIVIVEMTFLGVYHSNLIFTTFVFFIILKILFEHFHTNNYWNITVQHVTGRGGSDLTAFENCTFGAPKMPKNDLEILPERSKWSPNNPNGY